ncbi:hypothetical protein PG996_010385 [Apiospora saccharicola]|uniref:Uncharacterized protein n=1 Tax=Apiospora saccharicola TaxID=335842 RepID=A0ABR1UQW4_9PEZI
MSRSVAGNMDQSAVEDDETHSTLATVGSEYASHLGTRNDILRWDDSQFRGLRPPPLPYETPRPQKKRAIQEIIADDSPRAPDGMTREIEELLKHKEQQRQQSRQAGNSSPVADEQRPDDNDQATEKSSNSAHAAKRVKAASSSKGEGGLS